MPAVILELLGDIEELLALRINDELAVIVQPASGGTVLNSVPDITVTGNDAVAFFLQLRGSFPELIPARSDLVLDLCRIIGAENILCDRAAIDESTAGCLIAEACDLAVRIRADLDSVLCDLSVLDLLVNIGNAEILVGSDILGSIALCVLFYESSLSREHIDAAVLERLIQCRLILTVSGRDLRDLDLILCIEIRMGLRILLAHIRDFIGECIEVNELLVAGNCLVRRLVLAFSSGRLSLAFLSLSAIVCC